MLEMPDRMSCTAMVASRRAMSLAKTIEPVLPKRWKNLSPNIKIAQVMMKLAITASVVRARP